MLKNILIGVSVVVIVIAGIFYIKAVQSKNAQPAAATQEADPQTQALFAGLPTQQPTPMPETKATQIPPLAEEDIVPVSVDFCDAAIIELGADGKTLYTQAQLPIIFEPLPNNWGQFITTDPGTFTFAGHTAIYSPGIVIGVINHSGSAIEMSTHTGWNQDTGHQNVHPCRKEATTETLYTWTYELNFGQEGRSGESKPMILIVEILPGNKINELLLEIDNTDRSYTNLAGEYIFVPRPRLSLDGEDLNPK